ncbi:hypothetical protein GCM10009680_42700 [Streptomyces yatensis]|uniref:Uncharacterized protein n=1 Tax=Streptomyces yatensis TaxID=155177 RepID=A0ABP4U5V1_9ACTN
MSGFRVHLGVGRRSPRIALGGWMMGMRGEWRENRERAVLATARGPRGAASAWRPTCRRTAGNCAAGSRMGTV